MSLITFLVGFTFSLFQGGAQGAVSGGNLAKNQDKTVIFVIKPLMTILNGCLSTFFEPWIQDRHKLNTLN